MVPGVYNYESQYRGDSLDEIEFAIINDDTGLPIPLTGATLKCQFRKPFNGSTVLEITDGSGITVTSAVNGMFVIDTFLIGWDAGLYVYDVEVTFGDGTVRTYVRGTLNLISDSTI